MPDLSRPHIPSIEDYSDWQRYLTGVINYVGIVVADQNIKQLFVVCLEILDIDFAQYFREQSFFKKIQQLEAILIKLEGFKADHSTDLTTSLNYYQTLLP